MSFKIEKSDFLSKGFSLAGKTTLSSRQQAIYVLNDEDTGIQYTATVDEYLTTEDALNTMSVVENERFEELDNDRQTVFDPEGNGFKLRVSEDEISIKNSICTRKEIFHKDDGGLITSSVSCVFQKKKFLFYISGEYEDNIDITVINDIAKIFYNKIKS